jgi:hypothetical protein
MSTPSTIFISPNITSSSLLPPSIYTGTSAPTRPGALDPSRALRSLLCPRCSVSYSLDPLSRIISDLHSHHSSPILNQTANKPGRGVCLGGFSALHLLRIDLLHQRGVERGGRHRIRRPVLRRQPRDPVRLYLPLRRRPAGALALLLPARRRARRPCSLPIVTSALTTLAAAPPAAPPASRADESAPSSSATAAAAATESSAASASTTPPPSRRLEAAPPTAAAAAWMLRPATPSASVGRAPCQSLRPSSGRFCSLRRCPGSLSLHRIPTLGSLSVAAFALGPTLGPALGLSVTLTAFTLPFSSIPFPFPSALVPTIILGIISKLISCIPISTLVCSSTLPFNLHFVASRSFGLFRKLLRRGGAGRSEIRCGLCCFGFL